MSAQAPKLERERGRSFDFRDLKKAVNHAGPAIALLFGYGATAEAISAHAQDKAHRDMQGHALTFNSEDFTAGRHSSRQNQIDWAQIGVGNNKSVLRSESSLARIVRQSANQAATSESSAKVPVNPYAGAEWLTFVPLGWFTKKKAGALFLLATFLTACAAPALAPTQAVEMSPVPASATPMIAEIPMETQTPLPPTEVPPSLSGPYPTEVRIGNLQPAYYDSFTYVSDITTSNWSAFRPMADYLTQALSRNGDILSDGTPEQKYADFQAKGFEFRGYTAENGEGSVFVVFDPKNNRYFDPIINGQPELDLMISNEYINTHDTSSTDMTGRWINGTEIKFLSSWPIVLKNSGTWFNIDRQLEMAIVVPTEVGSVFSVDSIGLAPEQAAAINLHVGLAESINLENGRYTTTATVLNTEGNPVVQTVEVNPASMKEDLTTKNKYGDTPVMTTVDGKKLYWIQEHQGWYHVEISPDIHKTVDVPPDKMEVVLRVVIAEFGQPFSKAAIDRWLANEQTGVGVRYQHLTTNNTRFAALSNFSLANGGLTKENSPVVPINAWFSTTVAGTDFILSPYIFLDPQNPGQPDGKDLDVFFGAIGPEVAGNEANLNTFYNLWEKAAEQKSGIEPLLFIATDPGFFDGTNGLITLNVPQPSLEILSTDVRNKFSNMNIPNPVDTSTLDNIGPFNNITSEYPKNTFGYWIDKLFGSLAQDRQSYSQGFYDFNDPSYTTSFYPQESQILIYPLWLVQH